MDNSSTNWSNALEQAKQNAFITEPLVVPQWVKQLPLADKLTAKLNSLLDRLPFMQQVSSEPAKIVYRDDCARALIELTYVQIRVLQLSKTLSTTEKEVQQKDILQNCAKRIAFINQALAL